MSSLSGYDGEAVGFDSVHGDSRTDASVESQTTEWSERGVASQTTHTRSFGTCTDEQDTEEHVSTDQTALAEFLRRVVPGVLQQLDETAVSVDSDSESEAEETPARLVRQLPPERGAGDARGGVLACSWTSNALAVSTGQAQHETWCEHEGYVHIYSHPTGDVKELIAPACVTSLRYHRTNALLALGTAAGDVRACDRSLRLVAPSQRHTGRVASVVWAHSSVAHLYLTRHVSDSGERRRAKDCVLFSAGSDGAVIIWRVNVQADQFDVIREFNVSTTGPADITCLDVVVPCPLRPADERVPEDVFAVGTREGAVLVYRATPGGLDTLAETAHGCSVVDLQYSGTEAGVFASLSADGELKVHRPGAAAAVLQLEGGGRAARWGGGGLLVAAGGGVVLCGREGVGATAVEEAGVTAMDVTGSQSCLVACGLESGAVRIWELPYKHLPYSHIMD